MWKPHETLSSSKSPNNCSLQRVKMLFFLVNQIRSCSSENEPGWGSHTKRFLEGECGLYWISKKWDELIKQKSYSWASCHVLRCSNSAGGRGWRGVRKCNEKCQNGDYCKIEFRFLHSFQDKKWWSLAGKGMKARGGCSWQSWTSDFAQNAWLEIESESHI